MAKHRNNYRKQDSHSRHNAQRVKQQNYQDRQNADFQKRLNYHNPYYLQNRNKSHHGNTSNYDQPNNEFIGPHPYHSHNYHNQQGYDNDCSHSGHGNNYQQNQRRNHKPEKRSRYLDLFYQTPPKEYEMFELSKELARILRHGKYKWIKLDANGFCFVDEITHCKRFLDQFGRVEDETIWEIVNSNKKKRFVLKQESNGKWKISAAQGHTIQVKNLNLRPIELEDVHNYSKVVHGTYYEYWELIKNTGLKRMNRNHIHFAIGLPGNRRVVSGMRSDCEVAIQIDLAQAITDGLKFFLSSNNVVLCEGDEHGILHPRYFQSVIDLHTYEYIEFEIPSEVSDQNISSSSQDKSPTSQNQQPLSDGSNSKDSLSTQSVLNSPNTQSNFDNRSEISTSRKRGHETEADVSREHSKRPKINQDTKRGYDDSADDGRKNWENYNSKANKKNAKKKKKKHKNRKNKNRQ